MLPRPNAARRRRVPWSPTRWLAGRIARGYARPGVGGVHKVIGCLVLALVAAGCRDATVSTVPPVGELPLTIHGSPSPYREVTVGPVRTVIPDAWRPVTAWNQDDPREGIIATPRPRGWEDGRLTEGMAALWVDGARVGVPSDYYYLAASGPALDMLTRSPECSASRQTVIVDHVPTFAAGPADSPGDYIARGQGTCTIGRTPTRWAYFVAAPGYGPARAVGIPSSCLYVVVAVLPDGPKAPALLGKLIDRTEFAGASVSDFIAATRAT